MKMDYVNSDTDSESSTTSFLSAQEFEEEEEIGLIPQNQQNHIAAYSGEPEDESVYSSDEDTDGEAEPVGRENVGGWCICDNCTNMDTFRERICCYDLPVCDERQNEAITHYHKQQPFACICEHPGFINNCLLWEVLENAWLAYKQQYGAGAYEHFNINKRYRHVAYRQLARFLYGIVGKQNRYVLPSCAVNKIRSTFSNPENVEAFTGFVQL